MHGGGAAYVAFKKVGAVMGCGVGLRGQSYAIPTMQGGVETIKPYVEDFIAFAKEHPELFFYVTRIGCGIAGFRDKEIARPPGNIRKGRNQFFRSSVRYPLSSICRRTSFATLIIRGTALVIFCWIK